MTPRSLATGLSEPPPEKVNYRSIGRGTGGVMRKRIPMYIRDVDEPTPSTVPTKYQTVFFNGNKERKGFGNNTARFSAPRTDKEFAPGPGAYTVEAPVDPNVVPPRPESASQGATARGKGVFASRTPRLQHASKAHGGYVPPGPGAYQEEPEKQDSAPSAAFALPGAGNPAKYFAEPEPGPGTYLGPDAGVPPLGWSALGGQFGESERKSMHPTQDTPGPGNYEIKDLAEQRAQLTTQGKWSSRRKLAPMEEVTPTETAQLRKGQELLKDGDAPQSGRMESSDRDRGGLIETSTRGRAALPGPGQYHPSVDAVKGHSHFNTRGNSSFQVGTSHLPRSWKPQGPGPGEYHRPDEAALPPGVETSSMRSETRRFQTPAPQAPGPAYYSPKKQPGAASFRLNFQKIWA